MSAAGAADEAPANRKAVAFHFFFQNFSLSNKEDSLVSSMTGIGSPVSRVDGALPFPGCRTW